MKILYVGDLHLYTKDIRSTKKMVENNEVMLKGLYTYIKQNTDIGLVVFLGDIQHATPVGKNTLEETDKWKKWFRKIGKLVARRYEADAVQILEKVPEGKESMAEKIESGEAYPLFTLKGNHDMDNETNYTFYDVLVGEGLLLNPNGLLVEKTTQINFHNYGEAGTPYKKKKGVKQVIGLYHDTVATVESPFWIGDTPSYPAEKVLDGVDLGIVGHIHTNSDPIFIDTESGGQSVSWTIGSMGRTSFASGQVRDVGYCALVDTDNLEELGTVEIDVVKSTEYFNMKAELKKREQRKDYKDFTLGIKDKHVREYVDPREDIKKMDGLDEGVRGICLKLLTEVIEG